MNNPTDNIIELCDFCGKTPTYCICAELKPLAKKPDLQVVILQHPQEKDRVLTTTPIVTKLLPTTIHKVGLSWPSLAKLLGQPKVDHRKWAILYLGSKKPTKKDAVKKPLQLFDRRDKPVPEMFPYIEGIIVLDGTWSQAKALWWRNAWMIKCLRIALDPAKPSMYGRHRREPKRECLSTLESVAYTLEAHTEKNPASQALLDGFYKFVGRLNKNPVNAKTKNRQVEEKPTTAAFSAKEIFDEE